MRGREEFFFVFLNKIFFCCLSKCDRSELSVEKKEEKAQSERSLFNNKIINMKTW